MVLLGFFILDHKYLFWANLGQKIKSVSWISLQNLNMLNSMVMPLFLCRPEILIFGKFGLESQNCLFKLKFGTESNSNMLNSTANFTAYCFRPEIPFLANFNSKTENCLHKMKFCNLTNARMIFIFFTRKIVLGQI